MDNWYNDNDPKICKWLGELVRQGHLPAGSIHCKSIKEIKPEEVPKGVNAHFFAGIGGWPLALKMAGWPEDVQVWTGSCPCQPFSSAGKQQGEKDERHLWPDFRNLIEHRRPASIFGEQVASKLGREWLSSVRSDLEALGYVVGCADLCAAGIGASHRRQRLFWVAYSKSQGGCRRGSMEGHGCQEPGGPGQDLSPHAWPDGFGRGSSIPCTDVCSPSYGIPARVVRLRGYGNAIVPQLAAVFIRSAMEALSATTSTHPMS